VKISNFVFQFSVRSTRQEYLQQFGSLHHHPRMFDIRPGDAAFTAKAFLALAQRVRPRDYDVERAGKR
jgi:hypothetical protein